MENKAIKVLSLDAGGIKGIYSLAVLAGIERKYGVGILSKFDYYVGSSIGGVIATAIASGISAGAIFHQLSVIGGDQELGHQRLIQLLFQWIDLQFGLEPLKTIKPKLFLPVYDQTDRTFAYFSNQDKELSEVPIADVLKSSCSDIRITEPYYIERQHRYYADAGFFAYDPIIFFLRREEALTGHTLQILSIGSGLIENISNDLNVSDKFDLIYDSFLIDQFESTAFYFSNGGSKDRYEYLRVSEFPQKMNTAYGMQFLVQLAEQRVDHLIKEGALDPFI